MRTNYSSRTLEDILYRAEERGIRMEVLDLAAKLSSNSSTTFFDSIVEAYTIVKYKKNDRGDNTRDKHINSEQSTSRR
jgi:hypothetical protein